ncbi:probable F420-dependent oxidoreductase, Rv2161c family [Enhydrobacter aerosaccus]|uniref:Probable F420-dependent oxidoreductase, Rv2161c family n=1 Tax=Enhydrobacter aerosaccus TaxID=225324 RepID=A0A1T4L9C5_9HYPH|nr:LLM class flavin-dependent oxidoreductase [Enhydrobacter aerosaccus]SJZ51296.1 probable F420-dependent oxidoreductase, Rv2161c family [Enhydrobacter aerosaccus]
MLRLGYLLPTRERIMSGQHETGSLLALAERAEALGFDSVWVGDSLLARPRHDPLTLLAAVAARTRHIEMGTAVLLPALRNPVVLAQQVATLDRIAEGRLILGVGIGTDVPNIRSEFEAAGVPFEKRVGRLTEGMALCRALWQGKPVDWQGRWHMAQATLAPTPHRPGGPPIWVGGSVAPARERAGRLFDGWFPNAPTAAEYREQWADVTAAATKAGRDPANLAAAMYLTLAIDDDASRAEERIDRYLQGYYGVRSDVTRKRQRCFAGPVDGAVAWIKEYVAAGATHLVLRFAGDPEGQMEAIARARPLLEGR